MLTIQRQVPDIVTRVLQPAGEQLIRGVLARVGAGSLFTDQVQRVDDHVREANGTAPDGTATLQTATRVTYKQEDILDPSQLREIPAYFSPVKASMTKSLLPRTHTILGFPKIGLVMRDYHLPCMITQEIQLDIADRSIAYELYDVLRQEYFVNEPVVTERLLIDWPIHHDVAAALDAIYGMTDWPESDYERWLSRWSDRQITFTVNKLMQNRSRISVRERLEGVQVLLQNDQTAPEPIMVDQVPVGYRITCQLSAQFRRPYRTFLQCPVIVNNQLVPSPIVDMAVSRDHYVQPDLMSPFFDAEKYRQLLADEYPVRINAVHLPWYDDWKAPRDSKFSVYGFVPILVCALTIADPANPLAVTTVDFADLESQIGLHEDVLQAIRSDDDIFSSSGDFTVALFRNNAMVDPDLMSIDGTTVTIKDRDPYDVHRLVVGVNTREGLYSNLYYTVWDVNLITSN